MCGRSDTNGLPSMMHRRFRTRQVTYTLTDVHSVKEPAE